MIISEKEKGRLRSCPLFQNLSESELAGALSFFQAEKTEFRKGEYIKKPGTDDVLPFFGFVLSGAVQVYTYDREGNRMVMASVGPGNTFGESLCYLKKKSPVCIQAGCDSVILTLRCGGLYETGMPKEAGADPKLRKKLADAFTSMICERTLSMNRRIQVLSKLSLREKVITFLSENPLSASGRPFAISMNREDMAAYLGVNRTALSRELSLLKKEGLIDFHKNTFRFLR